MMFQVNAAEQANSKARVEALSTDAVQSYRQRAAKEAAEAAAKAAENDPNRPKPKKGAKKSETAEASDADVDVASGKADEIPLGKPEAASKSAAIKPADISQDADTVVVKSDSVSVATDSLSMAADSLSMPTDSLSVPADSLAVGTDNDESIEGE